MKIRLYNNFFYNYEGHQLRYFLKNCAVDLIYILLLHLRSTFPSSLDTIFSESVKKKKKDFKKSYTCCHSLTKNCAVGFNTVGFLFHTSVSLRNLHGYFKTLKKVGLSLNLDMLVQVL